jgi:hypothetical protein
VAVGEEIINIVAGSVDHLNKGITTPSRRSCSIDLVNPRDILFISAGFCAIVLIIMMRCGFG